VAEAARPVASTLWDVLELDQLDADRFRSAGTGEHAAALYGGQIAAQALLAAGRTIAPNRVPHSLHGYFLHKGDAGRPIELRIIRDRDGMSFSARRVEVWQSEQLLFTMSASFHRPGHGADHQITAAAEAGDPDSLEPVEFPVLLSMEYRLPVQPYPTSLLPTRYWARCTVPVPAAPLLHAVVLTYLSDWSTGMAAVHEGPWRPSPSLDHAVWFHRPIRLDDWVLIDLVPGSTAGGRGWYRGTIHGRDGVLGASLTQESLYGRIRNDQ
jgi:acyl-CoA thioesterase-2